MGKYKELMLEYMEKKNKIIQRKTGLKIALKADMDELRGWTEHMCRRFIVNLAYTNDAWGCPWCLRETKGCADCGYGLRNGVCQERESRYNRILNRIANDGLIVSLPEIAQLISDTQKEAQQ